MEVTVATTTAEIDAIAAHWDKIQIASPHAGRALFTLVQQTAGHGARPHVTLIEDGERPPILVVARVERRPVTIKLGYRTLLSVPARWLVVVAGGVVGAQTPSDFDLVLRVLRTALRRGAADMLELSKVELDGPLHRAATGRLVWYRRGRGSVPQRHHRSDLSHGFDAFLAGRSKGTRWRLRRRLRKLDEDAGRLSARRIGPDDEVGNTARLLDGIAAKSYQRGIGVGFVDDDLHRELIAWAVAEGPFRIWTLDVDRTPVAYLNGIVHERTFYLFETAFDASLSDDEPGAILMARVLEELAAQADVDAFDYGYGDAQYKQSLSDTQWDDVDVVEFAARPRALCLNALRTSTALAVAAAKRILGRERIAALRRRKRAELTQTAAVPGGQLG